MDDASRRTFERLVASGVRSATSRSGGFTAARCWVVELDDGRHVFAKFATDADSVAGNHAETAALASLDTAHAPRLVAASEDGTLVVTEDLSDADWAPESGDLAGLWLALDTLHETAGPVSLPAGPQGAGRDPWDKILADPRFADAVGLQRSWLDEHGPAWSAAARRADTTGDRLAHGDPGPGNWCRSLGGDWMLVDWAAASRGNPLVDHALASLRLTRMHGAAICSPRIRERPEFAALVAGWMASELLDFDWSTAPPSARADRVADIRAGTALTADLLGHSPY
jgi:hypothetical protein